MTKAELINIIAEHDTFETKKAASEVFDILIDTIVATVSNGEDVRIGIGKFEAFTRSNGAIVPKFRPFSNFKEAVGK